MEASWGSPLSEVLTLESVGDGPYAATCPDLVR
jgi:hypothetical protein